MEDESLLNKELSYHEYCDLLSDAWLEAENATNVYPPKDFRVKFLTLLEGYVKDFEK